MAFRRFTEKELEELKDYMYILDTLVYVKGAMYLQHIAKITHKSYEQVTRDIKHLEKLKLIDKRTITTEDNKTLKSYIISLSRKAYNRLFGVDRKSVKGSETYLQKALLEGYLFLNYKEQFKRDREIKNNIVLEHLFSTKNDIWIESHEQYFDILEDKSIIFTDYFIKKNVHYYNVSLTFNDVFYIGKIIQVIEDLYLLFINCTSIDFKFKITVICKDKTINYKKILKRITRHRTEKKLYRKFRGIYEVEFRKGIDLYCLDLSYDKKKYVLKKV